MSGQVTERNHATGIRSSRSAGSTRGAWPGRGTRDARCGTQAARHAPPGQTHLVSRHGRLVLRGSDAVPAQQHLGVRGVPDDVPGRPAGSWEDRVESSLRDEHRGTVRTGGRHRGPAAGRATRRSPGRGRSQDSHALPHERHFRQCARDFASPYSPRAPG